MKPVTKIQIAVDSLQNRLSNITETQKEYAFEGLFDKFCYKTKNKSFCLECGEDINIQIIGRKKSVFCPHCNSNLKIEATNKRTLNTAYRTFGFTEIIITDNYDFQVVRIFELAKFCKKGEKPRFYFKEICQNWYEEKGKKVIYARLETPYSYSGSLEVRKETYWKKYEPYISLYCNTSKLKDKYTKYGISHKIIGSLEDAYNKAVNNPRAETLLKAGFTNVFYTFQNYEISEYWQTLKICIRHKFKIKEADIYKDYLRLLKELGKDLNNPTVVCPNNLHKQHNTVLRAVENKRAKAEAKRTREQAIKQAIQDAEALEKFKEDKQKFFNLEIKGNGIKVIPLKSIDDFISEASTHKHCVLTNKYYKKGDSLILKAVVNGKSIETIEFSLSKMEIIQSRGLQNKASVYHDKIINLVNNNVQKIKKIAQNESI